MFSGISKWDDLLSVMNINDRAGKNPIDANPFDYLEQCADGFIVVGYLKDTHEKFFHFHANDQACKDALCFFHVPVGAWMEMGKNGEEES